MSHVKTYEAKIFTREGLRRAVMDAMVAGVVSNEGVRNLADRIYDSKHGTLTEVEE